MAHEVHKLNSVNSTRESQSSVGSRNKDSRAAQDNGSGSNTPNMMQDRVRLVRDAPKKPNEYAAANEMPT